jgi:hypothetical protein
MSALLLLMLDLQQARQFGPTRMLFVLGVLNVTLPFPTQNPTTEESQGIMRPFMLLKKVLQSVWSSLQDTPVVEAQEAQEAQALLWTIYAVLFLHAPPSTSWILSWRLSRRLQWVGLASLVYYFLTDN